MDAFRGRGGSLFLFYIVHSAFCTGSLPSPPSNIRRISHVQHHHALVIDIDVVKQQRPLDLDPKMFAKRAYMHYTIAGQFSFDLRGTVLFFI